MNVAELNGDFTAVKDLSAMLNPLLGVTSNLEDSKCYLVVRHMFQR